MWGRGPPPGPSGVERRGPALMREGAPGGGGGAGLLHPLAAPRRPCWALGPPATVGPVTGACSPSTHQPVPRAPCDATCQEKVTAGVLTSGGAGAQERDPAARGLGRTRRCRKSTRGHADWPRVAQGSARAAAGHAFLAALSSVGSSRPHVTQEGALPAAFALKPRFRPSDECRPLCPPDSGPAAPAGTQCRTSPGVTHGPSLRPTATPFHEPALDHRGTGRAAVPQDTHTG